jgi:hypothetical protein
LFAEPSFKVTLWPAVSGAGHRAAGAVQASPLFGIAIDDPSVDHFNYAVDLPDQPMIMGDDEHGISALG